MKASELRSQESLAIVLGVGIIIIVIDMPYYSIVTIPIATILGLICLALLQLYLRFDINNYWLYQAPVLVLLWPLVYTNLPIVGYTHNEKQTHISFAVLAIAHVGAAVFWHFGVFRNRGQFPTVRVTFPKDAFLSYPVIAWLIVGAFTTDA